MLLYDYYAITKVELFLSLQPPGSLEMMRQALIISFLLVPLGVYGWLSWTGTIQKAHNGYCFTKRQYKSGEAFIMAAATDALLRIPASSRNALAYNNVDDFLRANPHWLISIPIKTFSWNDLLVQSEIERSIYVGSISDFERMFGHHITIVYGTYQSRISSEEKPFRSSEFAIDQCGKIKEVWSNPSAEKNLKQFELIQMKRKRYEDG